MPGVEVGRSRIAGRGVFARRRFRAGEVILSFLAGAGEVVSNSATKGEAEGYYLQVGIDAYIMPAAPSLYLNHSCEPNTGVRGGTELVALLEIEAGEELTFDYSTTMAEGDWEMVCGCGSPGCRGRVRDFSTLDGERQQYYLEREVVGEFCLRTSEMTA